MSTRRLAKIPLFGNAAKAVTVEAGATDGATFGVNLRWPDGRLVSADDFTVPASGDSSLNTTDDLQEGAWNLWFTDRRAQDAVGAILADTDTIDLAYVAGTSITATLKDLADSGAGSALVKITRDSKGRISGTEAATTTDLAEGSNLYYTDARSDARITLQKGQPSGLASLDVGGKLDPGQLPALAITETFVVDDEAEMLALDAQEGDVAVRTDLSQSLILTAEPASTLANWQELLVPTGGVTSFNGRTGSVTPASGDYTFAQIGSTPTTLGGYGITDAVPASRTVNGKALSANVTLSATDVGAEPAITAGTAAQFVRGNKTVGNTIIGGGIGTFPGNSTAGTTAVCYEVGTDVAGRGASIKSKRGTSSFNTGMVLSAHNSTGDLDLVSINDDSTVNFGSTLYIDEVNGRVGIGAAPVSFSFEVSSTTGGIVLNRQSLTLEPFIALRSNTDPSTGGQIRGSATGSGLRFAASTTGQPTMFGATPTQVFPGVDNTASCGTSSLRWSVVYAATSPINTSDAREKTDVAPLTADELAAAADLARAIGTYQWLTSVAEKGADNARHHVGLTVQRAIEIMQSHNLDPMRYGFICFDEWDELPEVMDPETGEVTQAYRPAGDRYSFRTDELLLFMARGFAARLDALEAKA